MRADVVASHVVVVAVAFADVQYFGLVALVWEPMVLYKGSQHWSKN